MRSQRRHLGGFGVAWALVGGILLLAYGWVVAIG